ncbi:MAG TPA: alpha/beta hydrolase [Magnetospirillaceae bacterium]|jgi:pimeloyl-ACP methyl ester carboxylesterase
MAQIDAQDIGALAAKLGITLTDTGTGRPVLLLHGGGGPFTVAGFAATLAQDHRVIVPTHPGFAGTPRRDDMTSVKDLARLYAALLERARLRDVLVIGFSMGGWIAAEMACLDASRIAGLVLANATGITVPGFSMLDVFSIPPAELANYSYHAPDKFRIDPSNLTEQQQAAMRANFAALAVYGGAGSDPDLRERLTKVTTPALVVWGESDRVVLPGYGQAFAAAFAKGRFVPIKDCGHMPQIEQPGQLRELVRAFEMAPVG